MKKKLHTLQKATAVLVSLGLATSAFAQAADDGFVVPLDEDFTKMVVAAPATQNGESESSGGLHIKQGLYIEVTGSNASLIRDIKTGKKKGYEFDSAHFLTSASWWFFGDIGSKFQLNAEIAVWDTDKTLYQANSYADNVPDVTWGDGLQTLATLPFSWMYNANDDGIGAFNKMGFTIITPWVQAKIGYGDLKANGMLDFDGIYHVIDRWDYVDKGFTEISLGKDVRKFGDITLDATVAFSMMRGTYGLYDLLAVKYGDEKNPLVEGALTFGSYTTEEELFRYNEQNISAVSAYVAVSPLEQLKVEAHAIGTFGTDVDLNGDAIAVAGRIGWKAENWNVSIMESYAAKNVDSVWGSDGQDYDDINANTNTVQLDASVTPKDMVTVGLDQGITLVLANASELPSKYDEYKDYLFFRTQPYVDVDISPFINKDVTVGLYGVAQIDKPSDAKSTENTLEPFFREAGIEIGMTDVIPHIKKLTFDYAVSATPEWKMDATKIKNDTGSYNLGEVFHSLMLTADITDNLSVTAAGIYRNYRSTTKAGFVEQPLGFALGFAIKRTPLPGHPKFWAHATYGMDPYEDDNDALFRADNGTNKPAHRTYLLSTLDKTSGGINTTSYIRFGLIWDL